MADKLWNAKYWADRLEETTEESAPILEKLNSLSSTTLSYEEMFKLRSVLQHYASYSRLLSADMAQPDPKPVPRWKKLLKK